MMNETNLNKYAVLSDDEMAEVIGGTNKQAYDAGYSVGQFFNRLLDAYGKAKFLCAFLC